MFEKVKNILSGKETETEDGLIAMIDQKTKDAETWLESFHRQWFINIAMRRGAQYVQTHAKGVLIAPEVVDENRVRMTANKIAGIHATRLAKLVKDMPKLEGVPASSSDEDKNLARRATKLLDYFWQKNRVVEKLCDALAWAGDTGNCFLMPRWDQNAGDEIPIYKRHEGQITGQEPYNIDSEGYVLDQSGERVVETVTTGDVVLDVITPFDFVNDGHSITIEDQECFIIQQAMTIKKIEKLWPDKGSKVKPDKDTKTRAMYQRRIQALSSNTGDFYAEPKEEGNLATVKFYFEKGCKEYPNGRYIVKAGSVLLEQGELPLGEEYNVVHIGDIHISGAFWKIGIVENVIPIQKGYNRTLSQIIENSNNMGNIKIMCPKNSKVSSDAFDDSGNEVIEYEVTTGGEPHQLQPAELPGYVVNLLNVYDKNFEDASGQHEVSHGKAPAGVKSGSALNALQEQDDTRLAPTKMMLLRSLERLGVIVLKLYEKNMSVERKFQIIGETNFDIDEFTLTPSEIQSINKDVRVQTENLIAAHKRLQQEQVMDLYNMGVLGDKEDPRIRKKVLQILEFGSVADIFDELHVDTSQAQKENDQFANYKELEPMDDPANMDKMTGQPIKILSLKAFEFENHEVHIPIHNNFRKSPLYRKMTPIQQRSVDLHVEQHQNFLTPKPAPIKPAPPMMIPPPPTMAMMRGAPSIPIGAGAGVPPVNMPPSPPVSAGAIPPPPAFTPAMEGTDLMTGGV